MSCRPSENSAATHPHAADLVASQAHCRAHCSPTSGVGPLLGVRRGAGPALASGAGPENVQFSGRESVLVREEVRR